MSVKQKESVRKTSSSAESIRQWKSLPMTQSAIKLAQGSSSTPQNLKGNCVVCCAPNPVASKFW